MKNLPESGFPFLSPEIAAAVHQELIDTHNANLRATEKAIAVLVEAGYQRIDALAHIQKDLGLCTACVQKRHGREPQTSRRRLA